MGKIIGIDLGTSNSCIALYEGGKPVVIRNEHGQYFTPSVVRFLENGDTVVGKHALRAQMVDPQNTVTGIKRFIGRRYYEVIDLVNIVPFNVVIGNNNIATIDVYGLNYSPQEIYAIILQDLKNAAERYCGEIITDVIITVPAYFNKSQQQATREAGKIAGFNVLRIIHEPTAAALAYGLNKQEEEKIAVFDLGGGTFDISILEIGEGVFEVKSVEGDGFLGGDDFDNRIVDWILQEINREHNINFENDPLAMQRIRDVATNTKCELSQISESKIELPFLIKKDNKVINIDLLLTRTKFEELCEELFDKLVRPCKLVLKDAGLDPSDINKVLLVGGATRMPKIIDIVRTIFGIEPRRNINPDEAVALGAAIQAGVLKGDQKNVLLLDVFTHSLVIETEDGIAIKMIEKNTTIPTKKSQFFSTMFNNQTSVEIHILEGDNRLAIHNQSLCRFVLDGIQPAPRGVAQIEVIIDIDANNIVHIAAKDMSTGKEQSLLLTTFTGLTEDQIEYAILHTDRRRDNKKKKRKLLDLKYRVESLLLKIIERTRRNRKKISVDTINTIDLLIAKSEKIIELSDEISLDDMSIQLEGACQQLTRGIDMLEKYL